ncbi:MAG: IS66 family transposase [Planctomycetes bacterium]|nr:IS66 family transposase [Planctomycetota bacterium]
MAHTLIENHRHPAQVDETLDATLPDHCPHCGGDVVEDHLDQQFQTEIPRKPIVRRFTIHCGHCQRCSKPLRGRHPLQTSHATGAAQSQLGGDTQAAIVYLNKRAGLSHGKIADTFDKLFGITVTPGASAQVVMRAGTILRPAYNEIAQQIKGYEHLTPDETGWRIGGYPAWLHAWVGDDGATLYAIDPQRSADVLEKFIGIDWSGSMTHDGFSSYERFEDVAHQQCVDHALRRARTLVDKHQGMAKLFPQQVIDLLRGALRLRDRFEEEKADEDRRGRAYEDYVQRLRDLTQRPRVNSANARFAKHLLKHAGSWFLFLVDSQIPATNHRAEQALKTPIVNRKVWGGNRTKAGGETQAVTSSVLQTCQKKSIDVFQFLGDAFRGVLGSLFNRTPADNAK